MVVAGFALPCSAFLVVHPLWGTHFGPSRCSPSASRFSAGDLVDRFWHNLSQFYRRHQPLCLIGPKQIVWGPSDSGMDRGGRLRDPADISLRKYLANSKTHRHSHARGNPCTLFWRHPGFGAEHL